MEKLFMQSKLAIDLCRFALRFFAMHVEISAKQTRIHLQLNSKHYTFHTLNMCDYKNDLIRYCMVYKLVKRRGLN